jgi:hypothetical protein
VSLAPRTGVIRSCGGRWVARLDDGSFAVGFGGGAYVA